MKIEKILRPYSHLSFLRRWRFIIIVLGLTMALLSLTLLEIYLIPEQLSVLGAIGALFILLSLLITLVYQNKLHNHLSKYVLSSIIALLLLLLFHIIFVKTVENYGGDGATHHYLIGFNITDEGGRLRERADKGSSTWSEAQYIKTLGDDTIPIIYGLSYTVNLIIYSLSYIIFVCSIVLTLGSLLILNNNMNISPKSIKILFLAANPKRTTRLELAEELRALEIELKGVTFRDQIELVSRHAVRPDDLIRYVREDAPNIIHFSGHGEPEGIILQNDEGGYTSVTGESLQRFLKDRGVELVVLNSCYSKIQADKIKKAVKSVIGTTDAVEDEAALRFTVAFYRTLGNGLTIREAFRDGSDVVVLIGHQDVFYSAGDLDRVLTKSDEN